MVVLSRFLIKVTSFVRIGIDFFSYPFKASLSTVCQEMDTLQLRLSETASKMEIPRCALVAPGGRTFPLHTCEDWLP